MDKSIFNTTFQQDDLSSKIAVGLSRISDAFRILIWEHAKVIGLSPIQIQILIFVNYHSDELCNVSHLSREFNVTKPTISDAIKVLEKKEMIAKEWSPEDKRAYTIAISKKGKKIVEGTEQYANPIKEILTKLGNKEQEQLFTSLNQLIFGLNRAGILTVQRTCYGCRFYEKKRKKHYCHLMEKDLLDKDIRLDCQEFEEKGRGNI